MLKAKQHTDRLMPLAAMALAIPAVPTDTAQAQPTVGRARWCVGIARSGLLDCSFHTFEQCMATASGVTNQCSLNSWYVEPKRPRAKKRIPRR
jgi:uncharacterized membrane protein